eukprot:GFYU01019324.1.p1 GENE.GFYU01019324.1~~GFYU01019324.1.p1  ORF type:complete len:244 (-),score=87.98 GFYU01019324.1:51-740(-)
MRELSSAVKTSRAEWLAMLRQRDADKEVNNAEKSKQKVNGVNPLKLNMIVDEHMAEDSIIVADGGDFVGTAAYILRPRAPLCWLDPGVFGTLGVGAGFALAAKLVRPTAEVWIIYGDGSSGYSLAEFDTFARFGLPVIALIGNDACWSQIVREQVEYFNDDVGCPLASTAYHIVGDGWGGVGIEIPKTATEAQISAAIVKAKKCAAEGKPVVINAHIGITDFRKGSISV